MLDFACVCTVIGDMAYSVTLVFVHGTLLLWFYNAKNYQEAQLSPRDRAMRRVS